jgi:hypothetical protein
MKQTFLKARFVNARHFFRPGSKTKSVLNRPVVRREDSIRTCVSECRSLCVESAAPHPVVGADRDSGVPPSVLRAAPCFETSQPLYRKPELISQGFE